MIFTNTGAIASMLDAGGLARVEYGEWVIFDGLGGNQIAQGLFILAALLLVYVLAGVLWLIHCVRHGKIDQADI